MIPGVLFADVELEVCTYLRDALADYSTDFPHAVAVHVSTEVPNPRVDRMVVVRRDGGRRLDRTREQAQIGVQVWGPTHQQCTDLANLVRALLSAMPNGQPVCAVTEILAPSPVADDSGQPMRFGTFALIARCTDLPPATPAPYTS